MEIRLALDNQISKKAAYEVRAAGYKVVYHASNEPDDVWIERALGQGATLFVSPDIDIPNYLDKNDIAAGWVDLPQGMGGDIQAAYILKQITRIIKNQLIGSPTFKLVTFGKYEYIVDMNLIDRFITAKDDSERLYLCYAKLKGNSFTAGGNGKKVDLSKKEG